jgi:hypothetical protein
MKKLNLSTLKERSEGVASVELLNTISGGVQNSCHIVTSDDGNTTTIYGPVQGTIIIHP